MADGTPVFDLVSGTDKAKIIIGWAALTGAQKSTLETAWGTLKNTSATLVDYDTTNYTVSRDPTAPDLKFSAVMASGGTRWSVTINLLEE